MSENNGRSALITLVADLKEQEVLLLVRQRLENGEPLDVTPRAIFSLVYRPVVGSVVTFTIYFWLLKRLPATRLSLMTYAIPIVAVVIGALWLDEPIGTKLLSGTVLVLTGVALAAADAMKRH